MHLYLFAGINCEIDVNECEVFPCQNGGTCLEHSNQTLYKLANNISLPDFFSTKFDYKRANGLVKCFEADLLEYFFRFFGLDFFV